MGQTGKASSNPIKETRADALSISAIRARTHHATRTNDGWEAMLKLVVAQRCLFLGIRSTEKSCRGI